MSGRSTRCDDGHGRQQRLPGVVLVLGACGAGKGGPAPGTLVSASVDKTTRSTARMDADVFAFHGDESLKVESMEGESDFDADRASLTMKSQLSQLRPGSVDQYVDVVSADGVAYERIDGLDLPPGKEWVAITPSDLGVDAQDGASVGSGDPANGLNFLDDAGRVRRFRYTMRTSGTRAAGSIVDMQFYDFGEPMSIKVPPAEKTVPFSEAADAMRELLDGGLANQDTAST